MGILQAPRWKSLVAAPNQYIQSRMSQLAICIYKYVKDYSKVDYSISRSRSRIGIKKDSQSERRGGWGYIPHMLLYVCIYSISVGYAIIFGLYCSTMFGQELHCGEVAVLG